MLSSIARLFRSTVPSGAIDALVRQVAELSLEGVVERVSARIDEMTLSEARGYVRARAAHVVRRQTRQAISQHQEATEDWFDCPRRNRTARAAGASPNGRRRSSPQSPTKCGLRYLKLRLLTDAS